MAASFQSLLRRLVHPLLRRPLSRVLPGVLLAGGLGLSWWIEGPTLAARYWQSKLLAADDGDAAFAANQLGRLGELGIAALVDDLNSDRPAIAQQCKRALLEALARTELAGSESAERYSLALARALDEQIDGFAAPAKTVAADLALRILSRPPERDHGQAARITALCDRVLRAKRGSPDTELDAAAGHAHQASITAMLAQPHLCDPGPEPDGLRWPRMGPVADRIAFSELEEPALLAVPADARPLSELARVDYAGVARPIPKPPVADPEVQTVAALVAIEESSRLARLPAIELFKLLVKPPGPETAAVKAEIKRRKFTPREIEVGTHLCSSRAEDRCRWAEALPGLSGIDAKMWLVWLSHDTNAQVRLTAVTLMATATDPEMLARVAEMARDDRDDRVQMQAARVLEQAQGDN